MRFGPFDLFDDLGDISYTLDRGNLEAVPALLTRGEMVIKTRKAIGRDYGDVGPKGCNGADGAEGCNGKSFNLNSIASPYKMSANKSKSVYMSLAK